MLKCLRGEHWLLRYRHLIELDSLLWSPCMIQATEQLLLPLEFHAQLLIMLLREISHCPYKSISFIGLFTDLSYFDIPLRGYNVILNQSI
jgi:hypothetical protein